MLLNKNNIFNRLYSVDEPTEKLIYMRKKYRIDYINPSSIIKDWKKLIQKQGSK